MIVAELTGIVLRDFYALRNTIAPVHVSDILILLNGNDEDRIAGVCRELNRCGLIDWQEKDTAISSFGSITANGVSVVERTILAPIDLILPVDDGDWGHGPIISRPSTPSLAVNKLLAEIDLSDASPLEKIEAKRLLVCVTQNTLLQNILASACSRNDA